MPEHGDRQIAIVGAGMAGLACAAALRQAGRAVEIFEKSRGLGGRVATRRTDRHSFDHGAQYVTARGTDFNRYLAATAATAGAAPWRPETDDGGIETDPWFVGTPGMSALAKPLAAGLTIHRQALVRALRREPAGWFVEMEGRAAAGPFGAVAVTAPAPQTAALVGPFGTPFDRCSAAAMAPCWTLLLAFDGPIAAPADVLRPPDGPVAWAARNSGKPGRASAPQTWVIQAAPGWSRTHLEAEREAIVPILESAFADLVGNGLARPVYAAAHRWRYARVESPLAEPCLISEDATLGAAGDWCLGSRVEAAFDSGRALGRALAGQGT